MKKWLEENLAKGFIRALLTQCAPPVLFDKKECRSLQRCVDKQKLKKGTLKNHFRLLLIQDILMYLSKARWCTKLDVWNVYNLLCITLGNE